MRTIAIELTEMEAYRLGQMREWLCVSTREGVIRQLILDRARELHEFIEPRSGQS